MPRIRNAESSDEEDFDVLCSEKCMKKPHYHCSYEECSYTTLSKLVLRKHHTKHAAINISQQSPVKK